MSDLVSVVIPVRNRPHDIAVALDSVAAQTIADWEVLVVDDGSTDTTPVVVDAAARRDPRVRLLRQDHSTGAQAARNVGIREARGNWVAFLDSDDQWLPTSLERRLQAASTSGLAVVHSEGTVLRPNSAPAPYGVPAVRGPAYAQLLRSPGPMFQGLLVQREALRAMGELDEGLVAYQEWDTSIRLSRRSAFAFVPEPTFVYDCRGTDTISKDLARGATGYHQIVRKHWREMLLQLGPEGLAFHLRRLADLHLEAGHPVKGLGLKAAGVACWPFVLRSLFR